MTFQKKIIFLISIFLFTAAPVYAAATYEIRTCQGNLETYDKRIIKAAVQYKIGFKILDSTAKIRFAGREFDAIAETGRSWDGVWMQKQDKDIYFSFLPTEGGTIKFRFEDDLWFSGNC